MKLLRSLVPAAAGVVLAIVLRADIAQWVENIEGAGPLESVFFRLSGGIPVRRPPRETVPALTGLINGSPNDAALYSLRALESEQAMAYEAAEADWKKYVDVAADKGAARLALADYYHRRLQPLREFETLSLAARESAPPEERLLPVDKQRPWRIYQRLFALLHEQALDPGLGIEQYRGWIQRYPDQPALYRSFLDFAIAQRRPDIVPEVVAAHRRAFPSEDVFPVIAEARAADARGDTAQAAAAYQRALNAGSSAELVSQYFELLKRTSGLRRFLADTRNGIAGSPEDLNRAAQLYFYHQQTGNTAEAERALLDFAQRKQGRGSSWTALELERLARLFQAIHAHQHAARHYYALYSLSGAGDAAAEAGLAGLADLLLDAPDRPIRFGSGNLAMLREIGGMDQGPGFWNGILSLLFNSTQPEYAMGAADQNSHAYFRRARAADLVSLFESRFPASPRRPALRAKVMAAAEVYGETDAVISMGTRFLADFPNAPNRSEVAWKLAEAYGRKKQTREEFATYDSLLAELAARAGGVPVGDPAAAAPRSAEYARVLDRYVARLVAEKRLREALALYRREIDRNPNDPGLYERLAAFLDQNKLGAEIEAAYRRAMAQFPDPSWRHKLARWYLRQKQTAQYAQLTQEVVKTFAGSELEKYFRDVVQQGSLSPALYLQLNTFATQRFPHNLTFIRNLLVAYRTRETANPEAYEQLLRRNWMHADDLRVSFLQLLSRTRRLDAEIQATRAANPQATPGQWTELAAQNPAAARFLAEAEAWRCHFEDAAAPMRAVSGEYPAAQALAVRAAAVERSLAAYDPARARSALDIEMRLARAFPRDSAPLTRAGEIEAERDRLDRARESWSNIPKIEPGNPDRYIETATLYWDYLMYDDALRVIEEARKNLSQPDIFAYEAGAIHENRRDYDRALREYARGALAEGAGKSRDRLLALARRPALRPLADRLTDALVSSANPPANALELRIRFLQGQREPLEKFLSAAAVRTTSLDRLQQVLEAARVEGMPAVEQTALERRVSLLRDPLEKLTARFDLARFFEAQGLPGDGAGVVDALYREHPKLLGVVRGAVDYHARNQNPRRAVDLLLSAANDAAPPLKNQFALEAARKATASGDIARARQILTPLAAAEPFRAGYIAALAATYSQAGDDAGLRGFYTERLAALRASQLPAAEKNQLAGSLRRGLIPALDRLRDFSSAADQYVELLKLFPEDATLAAEAAVHAARHQQRDRLLASFRSAAVESPRDVRWPVVLARIEEGLEDLPAAASDYQRALAVRPDRADLVLAKARIDERLLRFEDAARGYRQAWDLTYRNPQWMEKSAEQLMRLGRSADAVEALRLAYTENRADTGAAYFAVAEALERWGAIAEARKFAEDGLRRAADDDPVLGRGLPLRARIATRQRDAAAALSRMPEAWASQVAAETGTAVRNYYTPEDKNAFAALLQPRPQAEPTLELAAAAGMQDVQARRLHAMLLAEPQGEQQPALLRRLIELQQRRGRYAELASQMEALLRVTPPSSGQRDILLTEAAANYGIAGRNADELRLLSARYEQAGLQPDQLERFCRALLPQPPRLTALLARNRWPQLENQLTECVIQHGSFDTGMAAIQARGQRTSPLWIQAYTALAGLYHASPDPRVRAAFAEALGSPLIGDRIGKPVDRAQVLAGDSWFYYGSRFGDYLNLRKLPEAEDYRPAVVEQAPGSASAYRTLGDSYRDSGEPARAEREYRSALEIAGDDPALRSRIADIAAAAGRRDAAVAEWKLALTALNAQQDQRRVPPDFWTALPEIIEHAGRAGVLPTLQPEVDAVVQKYVGRNGGYQFEAIASAMLTAAPTPAAGVTRLLDLGALAPAPVQFYAALLSGDTIPEAQRDPAYTRIIEAASRRAAREFGAEREDAQGELRRWQMERLRFLVSRKDYRPALAMLESLPPDSRQMLGGELDVMRIRVAAATGGLPRLIASFDRMPADEAPRLEDLLRAASGLKAAGDAAAARTLLRWVYDRELAARSTAASVFLGAAELRLQEKDVTGATQLLRRMTIVSDEPFTTLFAAADLLERFGAPSLEFREAAVKALPWDFEARMRLAAAQSNIAGLQAVAGQTLAPYATRQTAAGELRKLRAPVIDLGSGELNLLAGAPATLDTADKPYFVEGRVLAAQGKEPAVRERLFSNALANAPEQPGIRVALFEAAAAARRDRLATAVLRPLTAHAMREDSDFSGLPPQMFLDGIALEPARRAALASLAAAVRARLREYRAAASLATLAASLDPDAAAAAARNRSAAQYAAQANRAEENQRRAPLVTGGLDQDRVVRPRLGGGQ